MAKFKPNDEFKTMIEKSFKDFVYSFFYLIQLVINEPRLWKDWETSDPFRDIVDTGALRNSGKVNFETSKKAVLSWTTEYVGFVYFGYTLQSGKRIPPRKWVKIAMNENDLLVIFAQILASNLK
ncbi:MAG: hypothetical protein AAF316_00145 [Cyanobacteria bacterium P01_A01_bin.80]